jgi:ABC-2 type transport system ATP-binding protein
LPELFYKVRNVKKAFGKNVVLNGVNLDVYKGEILGIIGTSGSGKTTLLHTLVGFHKPDMGEIKVLVEPTHRALGEPAYKEVSKNLATVKRVYGFASQAPSFYDNLTVIENLRYFGSLFDVPSHTIKTNMQILLHLMDLEPAAKYLGKNLSGGMERRLDIACALMHDPAVLILDEPTADLDPVLRNHIYDLIRKINSKDTTIILASHHLADLEKVCDRIAILKQGKIFAIGTLEEIKDRFSNYHQVSVRLAGKQYPALVEGLRAADSKLFSKSETFANGMVFYTERHNECAKEIERVAARLKDKVEDLHIGKPSLDDIFVAIMEDRSATMGTTLSSEEKPKKEEKKAEERKKAPPKRSKHILKTLPRKPKAEERKKAERPRTVKEAVPIRKPLKEEKKPEEKKNEKKTDRKPIEDWLSEVGR